MRISNSATIVPMKVHDLRLRNADNALLAHKTLNPSPPRYNIQGQSIFFPRSKMVLHISFGERFRGMTISKARRSMKGIFTKSQKDDIIHYLKNNGYVSSYNPPA